MPKKRWLNYCYFGTLEEALDACDWCEGVLNAYAARPEYTTEVLKWIRHKFAFSKMSAYLRFGENEKAQEICESYLKEIRESSTFTEDEY